MKLILAIVLFVAVLIGANQLHFPVTQTVGGEQHAVEAVLVEYVRANQAKDAEALATLYDDDAMLLPPDEPPVRGHAGILAFWKQGVEPGLEVEPVRVEIHGDAAVIVGRYTVPAQDGAPADSGKCVLLLHRRGRGRWMVSTDIWNTSSPRNNDSTSTDDSDGDDGPTVTATGASQVLWTMLHKPM